MKTSSNFIVWILVIVAFWYGIVLGFLVGALVMTAVTERYVKDRNDKLATCLKEAQSVKYGLHECVQLMERTREIDEECGVCP